MVSLVWLIPALPLLGFLILLLVGPRLGEPASGWLATAMVFGAFVVSIIVFVGLHGRADRTYTLSLFTWIPAGRFNVDVGFLVDPLSSAMILFVTGVGALIHCYSIGYMHGDSRFSALLPLPEPVRVRHAHAGAGRQPADHLPGLGGRRGLLVLPDLVLVREAGQRLGRQEGLHHQPGG